MALEVWLKRVGQTLIPATQRDSDALLKCPEGAVLKFKTSGHRSSKHHRLFMGALASACFNWPESHEFKPQSFDHFRAWILCKIRYCNTQTHELKTAEMAERLAEIIQAALNQSEGFGFAVYSNNLVYVLTPKSIKFEKLPQDEFNKVSQRVSDILKAEIQMSLDDFKQQEAA